MMLKITSNHCGGVLCTVVECLFKYYSIVVLICSILCIDVVYIIGIEFEYEMSMRGSDNNVIHVAQVR